MTSLFDDTFGTLLSSSSFSPIQSSTTTTYPFLKQTTVGVKLVLTVMADVISFLSIHTVPEAMEDSWEVLVYMATLPNVYMNLPNKSPFHKLVEASLSTGIGTIVWHQDLQIHVVPLTMVFQLLRQLVIQLRIQHQPPHPILHPLQHQILR